MKDLKRHFFCVPVLLGFLGTIYGQTCIQTDIEFAASRFESKNSFENACLILNALEGEIRCQTRFLIGALNFSGQWQLLSGARFNSFVVLPSTEEAKREPLFESKCSGPLQFGCRDAYGTSHRLPSVRTLRPKLLPLPLQPLDQLGSYGFTLNQVARDHLIQGKLHLRISLVPGSGFCSASKDFQLPLFNPR